MADFNKIVENVKEITKDITETVKTVSDNGTQIMQTMNSPTNEPIYTEDMSEENNSVNQNTSISFAQLTTSKKILWSIMIFTALLFIAVIVVDVAFNKNVSYILSPAMGIATPTVITYSAKAYAEKKWLPKQ